MKQEAVIALATPVFFLLIAVEIVIGRIRHRQTYRFNDAVNSIGLGVMSQVVGVFTRLLRIGIYAFVFEHFAPWALPDDNLLVWVGGLLAYDLCYYWLHRMGHEVNVLWAAHVVHHQSEDYNLSTALRQTSSGVVFGWVFYMPMALLGFPVAVFAVVALIDLLYQFWIHTEHVPRLGWFDRVFASPSNHRVHHAVNDRYLDRNYGGILILWDRFFGTFAEEDPAVPCVYGTRAPLRSWNPLWANAEVYWAIGADAWRARRWRDKVWIWFARPGWRPADVDGRFPKDDFMIERPRFDPQLPRRAMVYSCIQFAVLLGLAVHFLDMQKSASLTETAVYCGYLIATLVIVGALIEHKRSARYWEFGRLAATAVFVVASGRWFGVGVLPSFAVLGLVGGAALSAVFLYTLESHADDMRQEGPATSA